MRLGLIARCEMARGLAIQSKNFYDHMPVSKVLLVRFPRPDGMECPDWYENRTDVRYDVRAMSLDETVVLPWLNDLDVVFAVETPHDWRMPDWCRERGIKLVIQGNPEFVRHQRSDWDLPHPDEWWWPTTWRLDHLPPGRVMPVPMDRHRAKRSPDPRLHLLHVIGKRAFADRNGTEILVQAMRMVNKEVKLTVHSIDGGVAEFSRNNYVKLDLRLNAVTDQWMMYDDQDVLILPRRYGGLCLPALEATAAGLVVGMTGCSPNEELAAARFNCTRRISLSLACGPVPSYDTNANDLAFAINWLAEIYGTQEFEQLRQQQEVLLSTWDVWRPKYLQAMEDLL